MGSYLSCVSCVERNEEVNPINPSCSRIDIQETFNPSSADIDNELRVRIDALRKREEDRHNRKAARKAVDAALKKQINAIVSDRKQAKPRAVDDKLQAQINAIVKARGNNSRQVPTPRGTESELQAHINAIVNAHEEP